MISGYVDLDNATRKVWFRPQDVLTSPVYDGAASAPGGKMGASFAHRSSTLSQHFISPGMPRMDRQVRTLSDEDLADALSWMRGDGLVRPQWYLDQPRRQPLVLEGHVNGRLASIILRPGVRAIDDERGVLDRVLPIGVRGTELAVVTDASEHFRAAYERKRNATLVGLACAMGRSELAYQYMREMRRRGYTFGAMFAKDALDIRITPDGRHLELAVANNAGFLAFEPAPEDRPTRLEVGPPPTGRYSAAEEAAHRRNRVGRPPYPRPGTERRGPLPRGRDLLPRARTALLEFHPTSSRRPVEPPAEEHELQTIPEEAAEPESALDRAREERPQLDGGIDGAAIRAKIKELVSDPDVDERVDLAFSDENLAKKFQQGVEGLHIEDLGEGRGRGPRVVLDLVELSEPNAALPGTGDVTTSGSRAQVLHDTSSSRAKVGTDSFSFRVPAVFVLVGGRVSGAAHQRDSGARSKAQRTSKVEITETGVPATNARHQARYRISVLRPGLRSKDAGDDVLVDLGLKWPNRRELALEGGPRMGNPESIEHVEFSGTGGIYRAVQDKLGKDFRPNDEAEQDFRTVLDRLGDEGEDLLSGRTLRKTFDFGGKPVDVLLSVAEVKPRRVTTSAAKVTRTEAVTGEVSTSEAITYKRGGGAEVGGGDVSGLTGLAIGPHGEQARTTKHSGSSAASHEHETAETYEGPLDRHLADLVFLVDVARDGVPSGSPTKVEATAASRLEPRTAARHGWSSSATTDQDPTDQDHEQPVVPESARRAPDRVDATFQLPAATVDALVGPVLHELAVRGHVQPRELPRVAQRMRRFVREHARAIARGDGARFPLSAQYGAAPDVFFHGTMHLDRATASADARGGTIGGKLGSAHERATAKNEGRHTSAGIMGIGYSDIFWPASRG
ncbi:hypothetical protein [Saccharopolyspora sp. CA-218241]|uniref:hypothetical protein n=1 Tax=Saccharopolyspora sp. CA-218241 TaxID=3240027 RepID=UPI003D971159